MRPLRLVLLTAALAGTTGCSFFLGPSTRPAPTETVEATPELIARGQYLADHVMVCVDCHSPRVKDRFTMPPAKGLEYAGGDCFGKELGLPGKMCFPNITQDEQYGIGKWTDGEIMRAIREGVDHQGRALMPGMPYPSYRHMADEDLYAIVAYLRTVPPVNKQAPDHEFGFFIRRAFNFFPEPLKGPVPPPERTDSVKYGEYLVKMAGCNDCHTPRDGMSLDEKRKFAGGQEFKIPDVMDVRTPNITPDKETGIGKMTKEQFISRFKSFEDIEAVATEIEPSRQTIMPWPLYAGMTEEDLGAIYDYLQTVKPIQNKVETFRTATASAEAKN
jgi:mono/diheme cytochrome c family protein